MKISIVQDKSKETTRVTLNEEQVTFPEPCYYKLCDLLRLLDAKELSYQEALSIKKSHWVISTFNDTLEGLQFENQSLKQSLDGTSQRLTQTQIQLKKTMTQLNTPWWRQIFRKKLCHLTSGIQSNLPDELSIEEQLEASRVANKELQEALKKATIENQTLRRPNSEPTNQS